MSPGEARYANGPMRKLGYIAFDRRAETSCCVATMEEQHERGGLRADDAPLLGGLDSKLPMTRSFISIKG